MKVTKKKTIKQEVVYDFSLQEVRNILASTVGENNESCRVTIPTLEMIRLTCVKETIETEDI